MILALLFLVLLAVVIIYRHQLKAYIKYIPILIAVALLWRFGLNPVINMASLALTLLPFYSYFKERQQRMERERSNKPIPPEERAIDVTPKEETSKDDMEQGKK